uniref:RNase H type-1 domain-containing protein n=1 Tax=Arundo donax TaxID=35708 RepID=A0A0A9D892_ARUDO
MYFTRVQQSITTRRYLTIITVTKGVQTAIEMSMLNIVLETDVLLIKSALEGNAYNLSVTGNQIWELKQLVASNFQSCNISFCPRSCNKVAHTLAAVGSIGLDI